MDSSTPASPPPADNFIQFIGTATVLIRYAGFTILTDPNFLHRHEKAYLGYGLTSVRLTEPALQLRDLPPLDLVVLSHLHEDHFDRRVEQELPPQTPIITTPRATGELRSKGFEQVRALGTYELAVFTKGETRLVVTALPGRHGPGLLDAFLPQVMGTLLQFERGGEVLKRIYISGDTLVFDRLHEIPKRYPNIDLGLFHLGGTRILGLTLTMDARQGVEAVRIIAPKLAVPIHYDDYGVFTSPLGDFRVEADQAGLSSFMRYLERGEKLGL